MRKGRDIAVRFPGLYLVHHNLPGKRVGWHGHPDEHLLFIPLEGEIRVSTAADRWSVGPGRMLYLPAGREHVFDSADNAGERLIALVTRTTWRRAAKPPGSASVSAVSQLAKELLFHLLLNPGTPHASSLVKTLVQVVSESIEAARESGLLSSEHLAARAGDPRVRKAVEYLERTLSERVPMTVVARATGLSVRNMNRLFLDELGLTPKQVVAQQRIAAARALLAGGASVTATALDCGYQSVSQFITVFRQLTGQLPSEYARYGQKPKPKG